MKNTTKEKYLPPEVEIVVLEKQEVLTISGFNTLAENVGDWLTH